MDSLIDFTSFPSDVLPMVELLGMAWAVLTHTTPRPRFVPFSVRKDYDPLSRPPFFSLVRGLSPYHSGYPMSTKQEFALCPLSLQWKQIIVFSFLCSSEDRDPLPRTPFFLSMHGLSPHHSGYPMSAKQEFASCSLRLQWEQIIVLSFPSTLPRTMKAITSPLSSFPRAMVCTRSS